MTHLIAADYGQYTSNPIVIIFSIVYGLLLLYCLYKCAVNRHWILFILGFFCGGLFWIIGAILGPKRD